MNQPPAPTKPAPAPPTHQHPQTPAPVRPAGTERAIAWATTLAPIATGLAAPLMADSAALAASTLYTAGLAGASLAYMQRIPTHVLDQLPAGDILHAHRSPLLQSTLASGMALAMGTLQGPAGTDALLAGFLTLPSVPGIVSLGWWGVTALIPWRLRSVLTGHRSRRTRKTPTAGQPGARAPMLPLTDADQILHRWGTHISHPDKGTHRGQVLTLHTLTPQHWAGHITARAGQAVTVTTETVSSVYEKPSSWISITPGPHAGVKEITVNLTKPANLDTSTLQGAWSKWAARKGGLMEGTHLEQIQDDPNTGGQVALIVAGESLDRLTHPDRSDLAGALRTPPLLISYEPRLDPRKAVIRKMAHNPLQQGAAFPGTHVLRPNDNGYIQLGPGVSGFPARIQLFDPKLGAQHVLITGVTGSGKGGTLQLIALAHHINNSAIIYADPKGSSNPAITQMAAYSGLGLEGSLGALRVWYRLLEHRVAQSARLGMKNFKPTPDMPWAPLIFDEASSHLGESAEYRKEAVFIIKEGARLGRSLGMPVILANQLMQLSQLGGEAAIRDNIFMGGSLVLLRSDSQQKHLVDLPENFAGCNPADIPPAWTADRDMVFDPTKPLDDPERTFGLAFAASPGGHAEMMRNWLLEDATPYIDTTKVACPADWPEWEDRDEIAATSVLPDDKGSGDDAGGSDFGSFLAPPPAKPATTQDKILAVLRDAADPAGIDINYMHKDQIRALASLNTKTLNNNLTDMVKLNLIHVDPTRAGWYAPGPRPESQPITETEED
ncbi:type IV secretory system conjugative DNA transfer family protein [Streptomyces sp. NEAU-H3]|uniref:type IV secretory system conjugative DNA transfer family protein n=1 Tax=Streptomyces sp. NEAU-H3 TaxID=2720636 RepID=UPI00143A38A9|nr:hypothetical protein [Streptomyces sp. NEAU-H3]NJA59179.1 hypothetical protein [Streptomyces sp. NEAU-H3]